jgi:outer membrane lipoprotein-sorting protein
MISNSHRLNVWPILLILSAAVVTQAAIAGTVSQPYQQMIAHLKSVKTYQVTIQEKVVLQPTDSSDKPRTIASSDDVLFKRPNLFSFRNDSLMGGVSVVCDGKTQYYYSSLTQEYASKPAPADVLGGVLGQMQGGKAMWSVPSATVVDGVPVIKLVGTASSPRGAVNITLYIRKKDTLPYEAIICLPEISDSTGSGLKITRTELFTDQKVNAPVPDSAFTFIPPAGSTKVDSLGDMGGGFGQGGLD